MAMLVRAHGAPETLVAPVRDAMRRIGPTFAVFTLMPMPAAAAGDDLGTGVLRRPDGGVRVGALLLACLGIYALISYSVGRRSREIGVRLALGARPADVIAMLLRRDRSVGGAGLVAGLTLGDRRSRAPSPAACTVSASIRGCSRRWRCRWRRRSSWRRGCRRAAPPASNRRSRFGTSESGLSWGQASRISVALSWGQATARPQSLVVGSRRSVFTRE